jgi:hypothetical protein
MKPRPSDTSAEPDHRRKASIVAPAGMFAQESAMDLPIGRTAMR